MVRQSGLKLAEMQVAGITMRQLRDRLKIVGQKAPSPERLFGRPGKPTGLLEEMPHAPGRYRFTEVVMRILEK